MRLKDKVTIITGGGRGMGRAIALEVSRQGAKVVAADINLDAANETAKLAGGDAIALKVDVTKKADTLRMASEVEQRFARIDVLVNNAGSRCLKGFLEHTEDDWHRMIDV